MWKKTFTKLYQGVLAEDIWSLWTDVNNWPTWHADLEYCKMETPFEVGNHFYLKPKGAPPVKIILTEIKKEHQFTDCTTFFGAKMYDTHTLEETKDGLLLTNTLVVTGPLQWLWIKLVAQKVANSIPDDLDALVHLAKTFHA
ncbi:MAG: polyketide cyclase [Verrucomicrobia bacterium]|nr:MAG: polyketide cyclase [Verrucomicrobiota bacterium]